MANQAQMVDHALAVVRGVLDQLTARGHAEPAFEIARAQFSASIRASWPANLSAVARAIDVALEKAGSSLTAEERQELERAAAVLRSVPHD